MKEAFPKYLRANLLFNAKPIFHFIRLAVLFSIFGLVQCKKSGGSSGPALPPITQTGANTFGCMLNGQVWLPHWSCNSFVGGAVQLDYDIRPLNPGSTVPLLFALSAGNSANGGSFFDFGQNSTLSDHIFGTGNIIDSLHVSFIGMPDGEYLDADLPGATPRFIQITKLDTVNKIVSGLFAFTLYARSGPSGQTHLDSMVVTDGRFDLQIGQWSECAN